MKIRKLKTIVIGSTLLLMSSLAYLILTIIYYIQLINTITLVDQIAGIIVSENLLSETSADAPRPISRSDIQIRVANHEGINKLAKAGSCLIFDEKIYDIWGSEIIYEIHGEQLKIRSIGIDGIAGSSDDITQPRNGTRLTDFLPSIAHVGKIIFPRR